MDVLELSRLQFASTTIFHYFFVPVSIGLAFLIAVLQTMYVKKNDEKYKKAVDFWAKLFLINFAVGIVTGILQEFQFGMNWSTYSRFVGDVFGPSLAIEGLLAFFMESTFIGLWVFGADRLSKKVHLACIWLVSIGTMISAFWILSANAFMQMPVGYEFANGRAQMNDFLAILTNEQLWVQFPHTIFAALSTGAFLIAGISAWMIRKRKDTEVFKKSFHVAAIVGTITTMLVLFFGHSQMQHVIENQPMKLAAAEGLWETTGNSAPFTVVANIDTEAQENSFSIEIPGLLSFLSFNSFEGQVEGMLDLQEQYEQTYGPGNYIPPVKTLFWTFRLMVGAGSVMALLGLYSWFVSRKNKLEQHNKFLKFMPFAIALPFISNTTGWMMTELGRQPWVVFGLMKTEDAVSPSVTFNEVLFSLVSFTALYAALAGVTIYLFVRVIKNHGVKKAMPKPKVEDPFDKEVGQVGSN